MKRPKLGTNLEWHGNRIRVVLTVPPSLRSKHPSKLREVLMTTNKLEAEREKVDVIRRLRAKLKGEKFVAPQPDLMAEALRWRQAKKDEAASDNLTDDQTTVAEALSDTVDRIAALHGQDQAIQFAAVASGTATPLRAFLDMWFELKSYSVGYKEDIRRVLDRLEAWCIETRTRPTIEAIKEETAAQFVHEQYVKPGVDYVTANKDISCLSSYWRSMRRHGIKLNPWHEQRLGKPSHNDGIKQGEKRPFDNQEVRVLLEGIRVRRDWQFSVLSALSGLRIDEIGQLRVANCIEGKIAVTKAKTPSGIRTIPMHPLLVPLIEARSKGKSASDFLFEELPDQRADSKRTRSAPVVQSFSRERVRLGVNERSHAKQRQSNIDFHSWRRWFIRQTVEALEKGAVGFIPWTIPSVVGHKVKNGKVDGVQLPLTLTMSHYPGKPSWEAMTACVNSVQLPSGLSLDRTDFVEDALPKIRRKVRLRSVRTPAAG